jgi:TonB-linked SusC/RagA family outer membrane protein
MENASLKDVLVNIEDNSEFYFLYSSKVIDVEQKIDVDIKDKDIFNVLGEILEETDIRFDVKDRQILLSPKESKDSKTIAPQNEGVKGTVSNSQGIPIPGVTVIIKGTSTGSVTNANGEFEVPAKSDDVLVFSFIGMKSIELPVSSQKEIDVILEADMIGIEEVVAIGYGTMKKSDLTGSVVRADLDIFREQPNVSVVQSLQGSVAGLNVGQVDVAGEEPNISVRGRTSIAGEQNPLIVMDGVVFRGNLIDINPNDIASIDILKDASSAAIYGSQSSNGVMLITTKSGQGKDGKPLISFSGYYSFQSPARELIPGTGADYIRQLEESDIWYSRTEASGWMAPNPDYSATSRFKTNDIGNAYEAGRETDWYDMLTNDNMFTQSYNVGITNRTDYLNYYISIGYTEQVGYMLNEDYNRWNARVNVDNKITDWLSVGLQSFMTTSDYSGQDAGTGDRFIVPYATAYDENGGLILQPGGLGDNPLIEADADHLDKRFNLFGNLYAKIEIPWVKGLSYKVNFSVNSRNDRLYRFREYGANFQGEGFKDYSHNTQWSNDNIVNYTRTFNNDHKVNATFVYGTEKRQNDGTRATATVFTNDELGYNRLQAGSSELQMAESDAWEESSMSNMGRLFYSYRDKYLVTGTIRRDGFSGFSENNKFGMFPSASVAWVTSEESFVKENVSWMDYLKLRVSYGSNGNRTVGRYQTLARVNGRFSYITADGGPVYGQYINELASPDLRWETTTGVNAGFDFGVINQRLSGTVDYYNNNTKDLLYNVDIPGITRYQTFPTNLGKMHNNGVEASLTSINIKKTDFTWSTSVVFSRNRNELKELLGFDNNGDGVEDDIVASGLFIGEPLSAIFTHQITGELYQLDEEIPTGFDIGAYKIEDIDEDGTITPDDRKIIGYADPSYRFSISNEARYKNWTLKVFINSIQGGRDYYLGRDDLLDFNSINSENLFQRNFPVGLDYWLPENPNATYQKMNINVSGGQQGRRYMQRNFVRLQDVSLSYNLPSSILKKWNMQSLRVFASGKNLVTWTKWPGWDPETNTRITRGGRPVVKSYTLGLNLEF